MVMFHWPPGKLACYLSQKQEHRRRNTTWTSLYRLSWSFSCRVTLCFWTHSLHSSCMQLWIARHSVFWIPTEMVYLSTIWLLHGWCHMKMQPSWGMFCADHTVMHQFTVLFEATYVGCMCLAVTCHLNFVWMIGIFYVLPRQHGGEMDTKIRVWHRWY